MNKEKYPISIEDLSLERLEKLESYKKQVEQEYLDRVRRFYRKMYIDLNDKLKTEIEGFSEAKGQERWKLFINYMKGK